MPFRCFKSCFSEKANFATISKGFRITQADQHLSQDYNVPSVSLRHHWGNHWSRSKVKPVKKLELLERLLRGPAQCDCGMGWKQDMFPSKLN